MYPNSAGVHFDMTYYLDRHMPMVGKLLGGALKSMNVDEGLAGGAPGAPATYVAMCHLFFDSVDAFQTAFGQHSDVILAEVEIQLFHRPMLSRQRQAATLSI
jgi:uncharacterized protein (TIGR02118 family)